ncbi:MAG TPA: rhomboid family intramembrane serine protease [Pseudonocardiaceae bacterium]|nr:rhomboid family intramembrane serine protease [Pseudonocardiaceae bacterium]
MTVPPGQPVGPPAQQPALPACARHPGRPTGLRCSRCDRPACVECLRPAAVGQHCVDCLAEGRRTTRQPVTISGARTDRRPIVLPILIGINVLVFVVTVIQARSITNLQGSSLFDNWALLPLLTRNGYWWQLITAGFLHVSVIHILMNMIALWVIGRDMERVLGPFRFGIVYLLGVFGGNVAVFVFGAANAPEAGASTGVFALMGGLLVVVYRLKVNPSQVIGLIVVNLVISVVIPGISLLGHLGGLITGIAVTFALVNVPAERRTLWQTVTVVAAVVVLLGLVAVRVPQLPVLT